MIVDTGGVDVDQNNPIELQVVEQGKWARDEADCIIIVLDNRQGLTPHDREVVDEIRKSSKPFVIAINKIDSPSQHYILPEFNTLGVKNMLPVSAEHGHGIFELMNPHIRFPEAPCGYVLQKAGKSDSHLQAFLKA